MRRNLLPAETCRGAIPCRDPRGAGAEKTPTRDGSAGTMAGRRRAGPTRRPPEGRPAPGMRRGAEVQLQPASARSGPRRTACARPRAGLGPCGPASRLRAHPLHPSSAACPPRRRTGRGARPRPPAGCSQIGGTAAAADVPGRDGLQREAGAEQPGGRGVLEVDDAQGQGPVQGRVDSHTREQDRRARARPIAAALGGFS